MAASANPRILCTGISVLDEVFRVDEFPAPDAKVMAREFVTVGGGCAANAAVAIARLGGATSFAGPMGGPAGEEPISDRILSGLQHEGIDTAGCVRLDGVASALSAISVNKRGERSIVTYRDHGLDTVKPRDPAALVADIDAVLADNRFPNFTRPICHAARERGLAVVLDADKPTRADDPQLKIATHVIFSGEALRATAGHDDLKAALKEVGGAIPGFLAVTDGADPVLWRDEAGAIRELPVFEIEAVDTLAAGDAFHAGFTFALVEGSDCVAALRFGAAVAALKCRRFGGSSTAPTRAEVAAFLAAFSFDA